MTRINHIFLVLLCCSGTIVDADEGESNSSSESDFAFFESKIRPLLVKHCYECHSSESDEGGLRVDLRDAIRTGGERGPAVVPGRPNASVLLTAITHADPDLKMPPKQPKLSKSEIADIRKWIERGAPDPRADEAASPRESWKEADAAKEHWAYQPPMQSAIPDVEDARWPLRDLDRFILAALTKQGMKPSADADFQTLLRRVHFDLVGLPPSPADVDQFLTDQQARGTDQALADVVDQ